MAARAKAKPIELDPEPVIRMREREKPVDLLTVVALDGAGKPVYCRTGSNAESVLVPYTGYVPDNVLVRLKKGVAEQFVVRWIGTDIRQNAMAVAQGWRKADQANNEFYVPAQTGIPGAGAYENIDTILALKPIADAIEVNKAKAYANDTERYLQNRKDEVGGLMEDATGGAIKAQNVTQSFKAGDPSEGLTKNSAAV